MAGVQAITLSSQTLSLTPTHLPVPARVARSGNYTLAFTSVSGSYFVDGHSDIVQLVSTQLLGEEGEGRLGPAS